MLFLTRKPGQAVIINDSIEVNVIEVHGKTVKLGFKFPATESVLRQELYEKIKKETADASKASAHFQEIIENSESGNPLEHSLTLLSGIINSAFEEKNLSNSSDNEDQENNP
jgi:carbon storage regulator